MKTYWIVFGDGNPATNTGLSPTFTLFAGDDGATLLTPPGITEIPSSSGWYRFQYHPTFSINFTCDGGAGLATSDRYAVGVLDPLQIVDQRLGTADDDFGNTTSTPTTMFGLQKRSFEFTEGNAVFTKSTGVWENWAKSASTLLFQKTLTNNTTESTKS